MSDTKPPDWREDPNPIPYPEPPQKRIGEEGRLTTSDPASNARLASIHPPGDGWNPTKLVVLGATVVVALLASLAPALATIGGVWGTVAAAVLGGIGTGLAAYFGLKSAGTAPRPPNGG